MFDWDDPLDEADGPKPVDFATLSIKELKQRIKDAGLRIPPGVAEKSELVELLKSAPSPTAAPSAPAAPPPAAPAAPPPAPAAAAAPTPAAAAVPPPPPAAAAQSSPPAAAAPQAASGPLSTWRCMIKPRMVVRERMDTEAPMVRGLPFGKEVQVVGEPINNWVTLKDGGFALIMHEKLGRLLEKLDAEITVKVYLDRANDVCTELKVPRRSAAAELKQRLADSDPTGSTKPEDFYLSLPAANGESAKAVPDGEELTEEHAELEVVVRSGGGDGGDRGTVDWEAVREESARKILAAVGKPYQVLDLEPGAKSADVRRAYHRLSLLHHPDKGGDADVFKAVGDAYKSLTQAKDESGGWRDLEGQAVGPWPGHTRMVKGVNVIKFDHISCPPWESRRLYSGAFQEGGVRCWELSKGEPGKVQPPPRLLGEIHSGGFLNDIALLSPFGLLTAQSAGLKPMPGESMRIWNLNITPFRIAKNNKKALADDGQKGRTALADEKPSAGGGGASWDKKRGANMSMIGDEDGAGGAEGALAEYEPPAHATEDLLKSTMVYQHYRGVRSVSLWPRPEYRAPSPQLAATISKDWMAIWKINMHGLGLETPCIWKTPDATGGTDPCVMRHESAERLWTSQNDGFLKSWDVTISSEKSTPLTNCHSKANGSITGMELWPQQGAMVYSHSAGFGFYDMRASQVIRNQYTKGAVGGLSTISFQSPILFAGIGKELMQYDTRLFRDGIDSKPKAVSSWTLRGEITAVHCTETSKSHVLVAVGCDNGQVAAFDTT